jgi:hypothetical protein
MMAPRECNGGEERARSKQRARRTDAADDGEQ